MRKLRLRYAVPVYVLPKAPTPSLAGKRGQAHEFPWMMSPFRAGCAVEPSQLGQRQAAMHHRIALIVSPSRNPTQGRGSRQMVSIHRKPPPPPRREDNTPWIAPAAGSNPSLEGWTNNTTRLQTKRMSPGAVAHVQQQRGRSEPAPPGQAKGHSPPDLV
jgi:hypothetical protein